MRGSGMLPVSPISTTCWRWPRPGLDEARLDAIIAGLLHGVIKENVGTLDELKKQFGETVANIVNGATRITNVRYNSTGA